MYALLAFYTHLYFSTYHNVQISWIPHLHLTTCVSHGGRDFWQNQYTTIISWLESLTPLAVLMGFAFNLGTKTFRYWGGTAAMISTRRGCAERPYLAAVLVFTLKVKHLALSRSQCFTVELPKGWPINSISNSCHSLSFHQMTIVALTSVNIRELEEQNSWMNDFIFPPGVPERKRDDYREGAQDSDTM